ncbi:MAG: DUF721 domain-containing protein [Deltaproteobacteria bacterium]|jgi:predicted nucleic acid-binding Zn ribbon protein|nr:DUF721 domain-containing protein [Deltaproteobacteria bacterium]
MSSRKYTNDLVSLKSLLERSGQRGVLYFLFQNQRILDLWPLIAGPEAAKHTRVHLFREGVLHVRVEASAYLDRYRYSLKQWVKQFEIELQAPVVEKIELRLGPVDQKLKSES